jgi:hypothetical protein
LHADGVVGSATHSNASALEAVYQMQGAKPRPEWNAIMMRKLYAASPLGSSITGGAAPALTNGVSWPAPL